jgi:hypothetical protein
MPATTFDWEVLKDPEKTFTGPFRWIDLVLSARDQAWPDGIVFRNRFTGEIKTYRNGQLSADIQPTSPTA